MRTITRRDLLLSAAPLALPAQTGADPVAETLIQTRPESWGFDWGDGVQMLGLLTLSRVAREPRYSAWVEKWARYHLPKGVETLLGNQPGSPRKGFCGPWVCFTAFLELADQGRGNDLVAAARETARYITTGAERNKEGSLGHYIGNHQIWVDTLAMACPLLCRLAVKDRNPAWFDDAVLQILLAVRHVEDPATGFLYHMWDWDTNRRTGTLWGRGNGWMIITLADTLELLPASHPRRGEVLEFMRRHTQAWMKAADSDGLWHTILNDPASYAEASASAFAVYGLLKLARLGHLRQDVVALARKSWSTLHTRYVRDGQFTGVSDGTLPEERAHYLSRKQGTFPWGTGAYLLAASEFLRLQP